jgi:ferrous iron transport protein A
MMDSVRSFLEAGSVLFHPFGTEKASGARTLTVLSELEVGQRGVVEGLDLAEDVQHHLMHMGFVPEATVLALRRAPAGDPTVYAIDGLEIALRRETAHAIYIRALPDEETR